uniref:Uncharacterized protein n=1 Tax=Arundo donax TaxID=35708 RepID=A0A0A9H7P7_ARUDO
MYKQYHSFCIFATEEKKSVVFIRTLQKCFFRRCDWYPFLSFMLDLCIVKDIDRSTKYTPALCYNSNLDAVKFPNSSAFHVILHFSSLDA